MSPASSGALEIERYIGACLISSQQSRHKAKHHNLQQQQQQHHHHHQYQQQQHQQQPLSQSQQSQHHHHNHHNGNHTYVPDLYRGFHHHQQHPQSLHQQQQHAHHHPQQQIGVGDCDRWAGGLPLIVYAKYQQQQHQQQQQQQHHDQYLMGGNWSRRVVDVPPSDKRVSQSIQRQQSQECNNPLTRLAVHTQGAPLILSNNRYRNKNKGKFNASSCGVSAGCINKQLPGGNSLIGGSQIKSSKCRENNVDTVSVASDESSGSANSENCLPRIIKPRKRRKKDRKPPPHLSTSSTSRCLNQDDSFSTDSGATASPDIINITTPILSLHMPPSFPTYSTREFPSTGANNEISETPNLHHSFEDIEDHLDVTDINGNVESSCQCRYCDPSSQIWDIDRNCYSPFLTSPVESMFRFPNSSSSSLIANSLSASSTDRYLHSYVDSLTDRQHNHHHQCLVKDISTFTLEDTNRSDGNVDKVLSGADFSQSNNNHQQQQHRSQSDLEVSTEIVTSLNGHRDLEIKFFTSPTALRKDCADVVNGDSGEGEFDSEAGYLMLDVKCENVLTPHA